ncbi:MAG: hypothetical protein KKB31_04515 [Nanoarchaeota archaeon]|nr:hypothetical protein [Nanoarchaeota archaeon]
MATLRKIIGTTLMMAGLLGGFGAMDEVKKDNYVPAGMCLASAFTGAYILRKENSS